MYTIDVLVKMLHSVTEYDIIDCGYDEHDNKCYAIRNLADKPSAIYLGKLDINMFPEWKGKNDN